MENKLYNIILIILIMTQTISCQEKTTAANENHFLIKGKEIFYNDNKIALGMPIDEFAKIVKSEYRISEYLIAGYKNTYYYWTKKKLHLAVSGDFLVLENLAVDKADGTYYGSSASYEPEYPKYKSLEEVVKKYGKYDSLKVEEIPSQENTFYIFDKLGFTASVKKNTLSAIAIHPIQYTKTTLEPKMLPPLTVSKEPLDYLRTDSKEDIDNYRMILERMPKSEFKGKFTYNDHTADFSKLNYTDWNKVVKDLKLSGSDYDPPGDSKEWSREIRADYDVCMVNIQRYTNEGMNGFQKPSPKKVGEIDFVESIDIWRSTEEDLK